MKKRKAFTLAEVLISLTIIGVIAAITVPALIQNTQKQEYVSALKKAYSTLSQAANEIIMEEGNPKCSDGGWLCSAKDVYERFKEHLNVSIDCGENEGCFEQGSYKLIAGGYNGGKDNSWNRKLNGAYKIVLADGSQILFGDNHLSNNCTHSVDGSDNVCGELRIDINGVKAPNTFSRDVFMFVIKENGLYPAGCDDNDTSCLGGKSIGCACKVLREGAMNY